MPDPSRSLHLVPPEPSQEPARELLHNRSDDDLMRLAKMGHAGAFGVLVRRHTHWLLQLVAKLTSDLAFAEETAQEIWLAIWRGRSRYEGGDFRVYLLVAARNRCRNRARGSARQMPALRVLAHEPEPEAKGQLDALLAQERSEEMLRALAALRDADREALVLRFGAELDYDTMAQLTETKSGTLRARVHQGLAALRARLQKGGSR